ncbi:MAG: hypothetical protein K1X74_20475 [Pirellulales bacterium]|nr:hypothetical protein [Pirellulales bacterium]
MAMWSTNLWRDGATLFAWRPCFLAIVLATGGIATAAEPELPRVAVENVRRAFHNGEHNAFTDLVRFRDRYYLTFRTCPDGHMVHPSSAILVLSSTDGQTWTQVHRFSVPRRDTRDPHFLVFRERLFVYTGTWYCGDTSPTSRDLNEHLGYAAWTDDGHAWQGPAMLEGTYGHYVWRAAAWGDRAWLCGRRKHEFAHSDEPEPDIVESALLESDDGLIWRKASLFQETHGDETAFLFEPDGALVAVARGGGKTNAQLCRARAPFAVWQRSDLGRQVGGPLLVRWGEHLLVGGRKSVADARTALYWLTGDHLHEIAELPSGGDNSYPGFVAFDAEHALLSYYSSHERDDAGKPITAIYLAELRIER